MQPATFRESRDTSSPTPWSVVARRQPQPNPRPTTRTARYLELPVSNFMFRNKAFPSELRTPIKDHATEVHETLWGLTGKHFRFNRALALATKDRTPLNEQVVNATLRLRDLLDAHHRRRTMAPRHPPQSRDGPCQSNGIFGQRQLNYHRSTPP